jgi:hypothetical protein
MYYIDAITTTDAQLLTGTTLAEDPTTEWASGTFAVNDERHVVATHRVYKCAITGSSTVSPELDPDRWVDMRPTNLWAPFDIYTNTPATDTADFTYVLASRFCDTLMLRGLQGKQFTVSIKDAPGGTTIYPATTFLLKRPATGYWDYAFGQRKKKTNFNITALPIRSNAEVTITFSASASETRAVGLINRGKLKALHGTGRTFGGTETGATAKPKTYTYRRTNDDGSVTTVVRGSSKDLSLNVVMEVAQADNAVEELESLLGTPVGVIASLKNGYGGLSGFGFITTGPVAYKSPVATCQIEVEGII